MCATSKYAKHRQYYTDLVCHSKEKGKKIQNSKLGVNVKWIPCHHGIDVSVASSQKENTICTVNSKLVEDNVYITLHIE